MGKGFHNLGWNVFNARLIALNRKRYCQVCTTWQSHICLENFTWLTSTSLHNSKPINYQMWAPRAIFSPNTGNNLRHWPIDKHLYLAYNDTLEQQAYDDHFHVRIHPLRCGTPGCAVWKLVQAFYTYPPMHAYGYSRQYNGVNMQAIWNTWIAQRLTLKIYPLLQLEVEQMSLL